MKRLAINKYIKRLVIILICAVLLIAFFKILSLLFYKTNNEIDPKKQKKIDQNTSVFQNAKLTENEMKKVDEFINNFVSDCNNKDYSRILSYIDQEYVEKFNITQDNIIEFCNNKFNKKKICEYQNLSVIDNIIVYDLMLYDDIMATGVNGIDDYQTDSIILVIKKQIDSSYKITLNEYIKTINYDKEVENNNCKIKLLSKDVYYEKEIYNIEIENVSTSNYLFLSKNYNLNNISVVVNENNSDISYNCETTLNPFLENLSISPMSKRQLSLEFKIYSDTSKYMTNGRIKINNILEVTYLDYNNIGVVNDLNNVTQNTFDIEIDIKEGKK